MLRHSEYIGRHISVVCPTFCPSIDIGGAQLIRNAGDQPPRTIRFYVLRSTRSAKKNLFVVLVRLPKLVHSICWRALDSVRTDFAHPQQARSQVPIPAFDKSMALINFETAGSIDKGLSKTIANGRRPINAGFCSL